MNVMNLYIVLYPESMYNTFNFVHPDQDLTLHFFLPDSDPGSRSEYILRFDLDFDTKNVQK